MCAVLFCLTFVLLIGLIAALIFYVYAFVKSKSGRFPLSILGIFHSFIFMKREPSVFLPFLGLHFLSFLDPRFFPLLMLAFPVDLNAVCCAPLLSQRDFACGVAHFHDDQAFVEVAEVERLGIAVYAL